MVKWLQTKVLDHVESLPLTHSSIDSWQLLRPGLSAPDAKAAAFLLQNKQPTIFTTLRISKDNRAEKALQSCRKESKKKIDSHCDGGVNLYTKRVNIAAARKQIVDTIHGHEEPDDNSTFIFDAHKLSTLVYTPALAGNNEYKVAVEAFASEKHRLKCTDQEYIELKSKVTSTKRSMNEIWGKKTDWWQSFQPRASQISFSALLVPGVSDEDSGALLAWAKSFFYEEQMIEANLQILYYKSNISPQIVNLEEYERYPETEERLRFEAEREEMEGVAYRDDDTGHHRKGRAARRYLVERNKTLYLMANAWLNPEHEVSKIMLSQFKSKVDADDEKRKKKNEKRRKRNKERREKKKSEIDAELEELKEKAFGILKQQIVKFI